MTDNNAAGLTPVQRPGEDEVVDTSSTDTVEPSTKVAMPVSDIDKIKFRNNLVKLLDDADFTKHCSEDLVKNLQMFFKLHELEMMDRRTMQNSLAIENTIFLAFHKQFPGVKIEDYVKSDHPNYSTFETVFDAFNKSQTAIIQAMTKSTNFYDVACAHCEQIEKIVNDESRTPEDRQLAGMVSLRDLIDHHKGLSKKQII